MIQRTMDPELLSSVIRHPEVAPWVGGAQDPEALVKNSDNYTLVTDFGGFIFQRLEQCVFEVHTMFLPSAPSGHAYEAASEALAFMFAGTDLIELYTRVPENNARAKKLTEFFSFVYRFTGGRWVLPEGGTVGIRHYVMRYEDWVLRNDALAQVGRSLEVMLDADWREIEARYVGALIETIRRGQPIKALSFYNRWAMSCGFWMAKPLCKAPWIIELEGRSVHVRDEDCEVLPCQ